MNLLLVNVIFYFKVIAIQAEAAAPETVMRKTPKALWHHQAQNIQLEAAQVVIPERVHPKVRYF